jgi:hypothetical protein
MKYKYYNGFTKGSKKLVHDDPVLEGCANRDWRLDLKQKLDSNELDWTTYEAEWWKMYKANKSGAAREAPPCIKTQLHHGDLVVMHGDGVQKYYEVRVFCQHGRLYTNSIPCSTKSSLKREAAQSCGMP